MLMDELAYFMDWDLEAIVRGCPIIEAPTSSTIMEDPYLNFSHHFLSQVQGDLLFNNFPEFSETTRVLDELEELYKPFYPVLQPTIPKEPEEVVKVLKPSQKATPQALQVPAVSSKSKQSKKNLKKRVVKQVAAADIGACDAWAWRKYGQKPIKGSPYPRSYYRCSSSKGCLARKQVERNHLDPGVFLVTYTAEHNHPHPTRRSSLAGSTRKNNAMVAALTPPSTTTCSSNSCSSSAVSDLSPRTPLVVQSMEDDDELVMTTSGQQISTSNKGFKEEEDDFVELSDDAEQGAEFFDGWFPTTELDEMMNMGLDYQQLEMSHGSGFLDGFVAT